MAVLTILLALMLLYAWRTPSSWLGRRMHGFAAAAARRLSRVRPLTFMLFVLFMAALGLLVAWAKAEGLVIALPVGADGLAMFATIDVGTCVEVLAAAWLVSASGAWRAAMQGLRTARRMPAAWIQRARQAGRARRAPAPRRPRLAPRDEDKPAAWGPLLAAA